MVQVHSGGPIPQQLCSKVSLFARDLKSTTQYIHTYVRYAKPFIANDAGLGRGKIYILACDLQG